MYIWDDNFESETKRTNVGGFGLMGRGIDVSLIPPPHH
jgi:hypothetical protein